MIDEAHRAEAASYRMVLEVIGINFSPSSLFAVPVLGFTDPLRSERDENASAGSAL